MEHKHAVAIAESIGEFVEEREQAIRTELLSKYSCKDEITSNCTRRDEMAHGEKPPESSRSSGFVRTAVSMFVNDRAFAFMMTSTAILWAVLIWDSVIKR